MLYHIPAELKCLYLCFQGQGIQILGFIGPTYTLTLFTEPSYLLKGCQTYSNTDNSLAE